MALEVRRSSKEKNLPTMSPEELEAKLLEPDLLTVELNDFLASVDKIRNHIEALSWTTKNDLLQVMATVMNNPQKLTKAEVFKRLGICVQKGTKLIWTVYNELTKLQKELKDMDSSLHLQENCERKVALFLRKIKQCHFSTLCHLLHENMLELVKQEQICREGVIAFFASKDQRKAKTIPSKQHKVEPPLLQLHAHGSLDKSSEQEVLEEAVVSLLYAVSQVNELMERKDDLSDSIEYIVCAAAEELPKPPNDLHTTQPRKASYPKKRETGCPVM